MNFHFSHYFPSKIDGFLTANKTERRTDEKKKSARDISLSKLIVIAVILVYIGL